MFPSRAPNPSRDLDELLAVYLASAFCYHSDVEETGDKSALHLPVLMQRKAVVMPEPESTELAPDYPMISQPVSRRTVEKELATDITRFLIHEDTGLAVHPQNGMRFQEIRREAWKINRNDPLTLTAQAHLTTVRSRDSWHGTDRNQANVKC